MEWIVACLDRADRAVRLAGGVLRLRRRVGADVLLHPERLDRLRRCTALVAIVCAVGACDPTKADGP